MSQTTRWTLFYRKYNPVCRLLYAWITKQEAENLTNKIAVELFLQALEAWNVSDNPEAENERWNIMDNEENLFPFFSLLGMDIQITLTPIKPSDRLLSKDFTYGFMIKTPTIGHASNDFKTKTEALTVAIDRALEIMNDLILIR